MKKISLLVGMIFLFCTINASSENNELSRSTATLLGVHEAPKRGGDFQCHRRSRSYVGTSCNKVSDHLSRPEGGDAEKKDCFDEEDSPGCLACLAIIPLVADKLVFLGLL